MIEINNLTEAQAVALEDLLSTWMNLGSVGASRWTAFFADGDGNFRPDIKVDGKRPRKTQIIDTEECWRTVKMKLEPSERNGLKTTTWRNVSEVYMMDFDQIAWAMHR